MRKCRQPGCNRDVTKDAARGNWLDCEPHWLEANGISDIRVLRANRNQFNTECDGVGAHEILTANPGMTHRQLHYWTATGRVRCHIHDLDGKIMRYQDGHGSGFSSCYPPNQVAVAGRMYQLIRLGVGLEAAHKVATDLRAANELFDWLGWITRDLWLAAPQPVDKIVEGVS